MESKPNFQSLHECEVPLFTRPHYDEKKGPGGFSYWGRSENSIIFPQAGPTDRSSKMMMSP